MLYSLICEDVQGLKLNGGLVVVAGEPEAREGGGRDGEAALPEAFAVEVDG